MSKSTLRLVVIATLATAISGCASLSQKTLKAPCGPLAGMTDPCGDRTPINNAEDLETIFSDELSSETI